MAADLAKVECPAILIVAPGFNQGRTTVTAAYARYHRNQGLRVQVFKAGPDFLDPILHQCASGQPVYTLDPLLVGESKCQYLMHKAALESDLIIVECSTGLYDTKPICSQLANAFNLSMLVVVDGSSEKQSSQDFVDDLVTLGSELPVAGILVNRAGVDFKPEATQARLQDIFGHLPVDKALELPTEKHTLLLESELTNLDQHLDRAAKVLEEAGVTQLPEVITFLEAPQPQMPQLLEGVRVAIARDEAFGFIYNANLDLLESMGAELCFFSPINDPFVPEVDSLWFPGGFPELYLDALAANVTMKASIREFHAREKPILAECGGMLYMMASLIGVSGLESSMVGLLPGRAQMLEHLAGMGEHSVTVDDQVIRGHVFHHSRLESGMEPVSVSDRRHGRRPGETLYHLKGLYASYVHFYFPSYPLLTAKFFVSSIFDNPEY